MGTTERDQTQLTKDAAKMWGRMTSSQRAPWQQLGHSVKEQHSKDHPTYRFHPTPALCAPAASSSGRPSSRRTQGRSSDDDDEYTGRARAARKKKSQLKPKGPCQAATTPASSASDAEAPLATPSAAPDNVQLGVCLFPPNLEFPFDYRGDTYSSYLDFSIPRPDSPDTSVSHADSMTLAPYYGPTYVSHVAMGHAQRRSSSCPPPGTDLGNLQPAPQRILHYPPPPPTGGGALGPCSAADDITLARRPSTTARDCWMGMSAQYSVSAGDFTQPISLHARRAQLEGEPPASDLLSAVPSFVDPQLVAAYQPYPTPPVDFTNPFAASAAMFDLPEGYLPALYEHDGIPPTQGMLDTSAEHVDFEDYLNLDVMDNGN